MLPMIVPEVSSITYVRTSLLAKDAKKDGASYFRIGIQHAMLIILKNTLLLIDLSEIQCCEKKLIFRVSCVSRVD